MPSYIQHCELSLYVCTYMQSMCNSVSSVHSAVLVVYNSVCSTVCKDFCFLIYYGFTPMQVLKGGYLVLQLILF